MVRKPKKARTLQSLRHRPRNDNKRRVIWIVVLLLLSVELPEVPTYVSYLYPSVKNTEKDWFLYNSFHLRIVEYWYFKFTCERLAWICRMIAFTKTAVQYSTTVFLASFIILCYLIWDLGMFWWNYNTWVYVYEFMIFFIYTTIRGLIHPYSPEKLAKIKSIF